MKIRYEFKNNHGDWVRSVKPNLGPGISERVWEALSATDENIDVCCLLKSELRAALSDLLGVHFIKTLILDLFSLQSS